MNTILQDYDTPFGALAFDKYDQKDFLPALDEGIRLAKERIEKIKQSTTSYENTITGLEFASKELDTVCSAFYALKGANTNDDINKMAEQFNPKLTAYSNELSMDDDLFAKVKDLYENKDKLDLNTEQIMVLSKSYKSFVRNGALLSKEDKEKLKKIDKELSELGVSFSNNALKETNDYQLLLTKEEELEGLSESFRSYLKSEATSKGKEGWLVTLHYPSLFPFLKMSARRDLREKISKASAMTASKDNEYDNREIVKSIAKLRIQRANLLGYTTHAEFVLEERMAKKPEKVESFINDLLTKAKPSAQKEVEEIKSYAQKLDAITDFQSWDYAYYKEKLLSEKFNFDDEKLKPYFPVQNVIDGIFAVVNKMYGIEFVENKSIPVYHKDIKTYEVRDEKGDFLALFYADYYARESKRSGAWANTFREQFVLNGLDHRPHVVNVCNFPKPTKENPSLLTANDVLTLFHEFGHALHMMLTKCESSNVSGASVFWDFVELPSQIMENWFYEKECLDLFAKHYQTGEEIPEELINNLKASSNFHEGIATCRQLGFCLMDMAWHNVTSLEVSDVGEFEDTAMEQALVLPSTKIGCRSTTFGHIFAGGYSAGYYSYKWAEVLDADAFEYFKEKGIFNKEVAHKFRENILEKGGSQDPMELYKSFRGREPKVDALLSRAGLV